MTIAQSQAAHQHLLVPSPGETEAQMWTRSWVFTNNVCYDTRDQFAMIKKVGGRVCGPGVDCDKVIHRQAPYAIYDLVRSAGSASAAPICDHATNHDGTLAYGHPGDFVEPLPYEGAGPVPGPVPPTGCQFPPRDQGLSFFAALDAKYQAHNEPPTTYFVNVEGTAVWYAEYLRHRTQGLDHDAAQAKVFADIDAIWHP